MKFSVCSDGSLCGNVFEKQMKWIFFSDRFLVKLIFSLFLILLYSQSLFKDPRTKQMLLSSNQFLLVRINEIFLLSKTEKVEKLFLQKQTKPSKPWLQCTR